MKLSETLWGSRARKPFLVPISCGQNSRLHDLPWVPKGRFEQLLAKEGAARNKLRLVTGTREALPDEKTHHLRRDEGRASPAHTLILSESPPWDHCCKQCLLHWQVASSPLHQLGGPTALKLRARASQTGTHSFWGQEPALSPIAWQSNTAILFYFTQNFVSEIWFITGIQRSWAFGIIGKHDDTIQSNRFHFPLQLWSLIPAYFSSTHHRYLEIVALRSLSLWEPSFVVQALSHVWLFATPWTTERQAPLSSTISWHLLKFMFTQLVKLSNHLILCHPLLLLSSIFLSIRVF